MNALAHNVLLIIRQIHQASGVTSPRAIARAVDARGIATTHGGVWEARTVSNLLRRADAQCSSVPSDACTVA
jgi:hypothetical protein